MRRALGLMVVGALVASGCASRGATTTTTTVAATTTTTVAPTTTTEAGLGTRVLTFGLEPDRLDKYAATLTFVIDVSTSPNAAGPEDIGGFSTITVTGRLWRLTLAGPEEGTFEVIEDFRPDSGTVVVNSGGTTLTQDLTPFELDSYGGIIGAYVIDGTGARSDAIGGTPAFYSLNPSVSDPLSSFGPPLPSDPLGVGGSWTTTASVPVVGAVEVAASIVSEDEIEDALTYEVDYTVAASGLPVDLTLEDMAGLLAASPSAAAQVAALTDLGADLAMQVTDYGVDASYHLDPERGVVVDSSSGATMALALDLTVPDEGAVSVSAKVSVSTDLTLEESAPAEDFEKTGVLDRTRPDPFTVAADPLLALSGYTFESVDDLNDLQDFSDAFVNTRQDVFAGYLPAWAVDEAGHRTLIVSVVNGGPFRGDPLLAKTLAEYWAGAPSHEVTIGGRTAYREEINGVEWLLWNSDTHLFVLIGPGDGAEPLMQALMEQPPPYRWRTGDCLDFRDDVDNARPYAPFGQVGLVHCSADHTFEVIYSEAMPEGPDEPYPDDIADRSRSVCADAYLAYTGSQDELTSLIGLTNYLPDPNEWARGSRYLACGVYLIGEHGTETVTGRLEGRGPEFPLDMEVGLCLADGYPVPCTTPHNSEVIARLDYPAGPDDPLPSAADLGDTGQSMCDAALDAYGPTKGDVDVVADPAFHSPLTWAPGERGFYCLAAAFDPGAGPLDVTGTFDGAWSLYLGGGSA